MERALFNLLHGASRRHVFLACRRSQDIACVTAQLSYKLCVAARRGRREFHTSSVEASLASRSRMRMRDMVRHGHGEHLRWRLASVTRRRIYGACACICYLLLLSRRASLSRLRSLLPSSGVWGGLASTSSAKGGEAIDEYPALGPWPLYWSQQANNGSLRRSD